MRRLSCNDIVDLNAYVSYHLMSSPTHHSSHGDAYSNILCDFLDIITLLI